MDSARDNGAADANGLLRVRNPAHAPLASRFERREGALRQLRPGQLQAFLALRPAGLLEESSGLGPQQTTRHHSVARLQEAVPTKSQETIDQNHLGSSGESNGLRSAISSRRKVSSEATRQTDSAAASIAPDLAVTVGASKAAEFGPCLI